MTQRHIFLSLLTAVLSVMGASAEELSLSPLHVSGNQLQNARGQNVTLHGVMDTPNPYFNSYRWGNRCEVKTATACINYFDKLFTAITDHSQGAYCTVFRLHLDPCWTNNGSATGENDISKFSPNRLRIYLNRLYAPIMEKALAHGLYVVVRPPGSVPRPYRLATTTKNTSFKCGTR